MIIIIIGFIIIVIHLKTKLLQDYHSQCNGVWYGHLELFHKMLIQKSLAIRYRRVFVGRGSCKVDCKWLLNSQVMAIQVRIFRELSSVPWMLEALK